jgi:hypothetical protein
MASTVWSALVRCDCGGGWHRRVQVCVEMVNSAGVILAVHGAKMTNHIFMPTGLFWCRSCRGANNSYGQQVREVQLRYVMLEEETIDLSRSSH